MKKKIKQFIRAMGYELRKVKPPPTQEENVPEKPYVENEEYGPCNIFSKLARLQENKEFEFADIRNLNEAVCRLVQKEKRILELGAGTGYFATQAAKVTERKIVASEYDEPTHLWAKENQARPNVKYHLGPVPNDLGPFDLVVAIEIIEHVADFAGFIKECRKFAPRALITTPNRRRFPRTNHAGPPLYHQHVREWSAGEFYWVLRSFYQKVDLYAMVSDEHPEYVKVDVDTKKSALIADCHYYGAYENRPTD